MQYRRVFYFDIGVRKPNSVNIYPDLEVYYHPAGLKIRPHESSSTLGNFMPVRGLGVSV